MSVHKEQLKNIVELETKMRIFYDTDFSISECEKLSSLACVLMMEIASELKRLDLDSRNRKTLLKAQRGSEYIDLLKTQDKKPTEAYLEHSLNISKEIINQQNQIDDLESEKLYYERMISTCEHAHVFFRGVAKNT